MTKMIAARPAMIAVDNSYDAAREPRWASGDACAAGETSPVPAVNAELARRITDLEDLLAAANERVRHLQQALESNRRIGAAIGVVMAVQHLTEREAFLVLREASQNLNCKLHALADEVLLTGEVRQRRQPGV